MIALINLSGSVPQVEIIGAVYRYADSPEFFKHVYSSLRAPSVRDERHHDLPGLSQPGAAPGKQ